MENPHWCRENCKEEGVAEESCYGLTTVSFTQSSVLLRRAGHTEARREAVKLQGEGVALFFAFVSHYPNLSHLAMLK